MAPTELPEMQEPEANLDHEAQPDQPAQPDHPDPTVAEDQLDRKENKDLLVLQVRCFE